MGVKSREVEDELSNFELKPFKHVPK